MSITSRIASFAVALFVAFGMLFLAGGASASKQALIKLEIKQLWFGGSTFYPKSVYGTVNNTSIVATVETPGATPSIMWPANILSLSTSVNSPGPYTFTFLIQTLAQNGAASLMKSHAGAAATGGSTVLPVTGMGGIGSGGITTKCFASNTPIAPGPPQLPGSCFPRNGSILRMPGSKKYGGTARFLRNGSIFFARQNPITGIDTGLVNIGPTAALRGPEAIGNYGIERSGSVYNTVRQTSFQNMTMHTSAPHSTGVAQLAGALAYATTLSISGSNDFNTTNLTGTLSMVRPFLFHSFGRDSAGTSLGSLGDVAVQEIVTVTFAGEVPEPGTVLMLGFGALGLGGLAALRRR